METLSVFQLKRVEILLISTNNDIRPVYHSLEIWRWLNLSEYVAVNVLTQVNAYEDHNWAEP